MRLFAIFLRFYKAASSFHKWLNVTNCVQAYSLHMREMPLTTWLHAMRKHVVYTQDFASEVLPTILQTPQMDPTVVSARMFLQSVLYIKYTTRPNPTRGQATHQVPLWNPHSCCGLDGAPHSCPTLPMPPYPPPSPHRTALPACNDNKAPLLCHHSASEYCSSKGNIQQTSA